MVLSLILLYSIVHQYRIIILHGLKFSKCVQNTIRVLIHSTSSNILKTTLLYAVTMG